MTPLTFFLITLAIGCCIGIPLGIAFTLWRHGRTIRKAQEQFEHVSANEIVYQKGLPPSYHWGREGK